MHPSQLDVFKTVKEITGKTLQNRNNIGVTKDFGNEQFIYCFRIFVDSNVARKHKLTEPF